MHDNISQPLKNALGTLIDRGYRPVIVGGWVRDILLGSAPLDIDIELYGSYDSTTLYRDLCDVFEKVDSYASRFGIFNVTLKGFTCEIAIPRTEVKAGQGYRGFDVTLNPALSFTEAAKRRDFTVNAMGYDTVQECLLDPYGGEKDLEKRVLSCVNSKGFTEDALRLFRAVSLAGRYEMTLTMELQLLCRFIAQSDEARTVEPSKVFVQLIKLLLHAPRPSYGLQLLQELGTLHLFPALAHLVHVPQNVHSHPEGNVWAHTCMVTDTMKRYLGEDKMQNSALMLAALFHDVGKAKEHFPPLGVEGHDVMGETLVDEILHNSGVDAGTRLKVMELVRYHSEAKRMYKSDRLAYSLRKKLRYCTLEELSKMFNADLFGRHPKGVAYKMAKLGLTDEMLNKTFKFPTPLLNGHDLKTLHTLAAKHYSTILERVYEAQLEGQISTRQEALKQAKELADVL